MKEQLNAWLNDEWMQGSAAAAVCMLEPGLMQLTGSGVHPLHSSCLDIYTCLSSSWRLLARGNKHKPLLAASAYARGALYTLLLAHGLKQLLKSGQSRRMLAPGCHYRRFP